MRRLLLAALLALACTGCTHTVGRDFPRPQMGLLVPGKTSKADVIAIYGPPDTEASAFNTDTAPPPTQQQSEFDAASVAGAYSTIQYSYMLSTIPLAGGNVSIKRVVFTFRNDTLFSYDFASNVPTDDSNFDENKLSLIQKGKTTADEVVAILGQPTGEAIYPAVLTEGQRKLLYTYYAPNMATRKVETKSLIVLLQPDRRVLDFRFASRLANMAPAPAPQGPTIIPITIPAHK